MPSFVSFYRRFPGAAGFPAFSRVGFTTTGDRALVYYESGSGGLAGGGFLLLLEKTRGRWRIVADLMVWIS